jgi:hypothetical protein
MSRRSARQFRAAMSTGGSRIFWRPIPTGDVQYFLLFSDFLLIEIA